MIVRALTSTGDWTFGAGKNNYLSQNAAVAQAIGTRLSSFLGDCFFATNDGIDWFNLLGSKNQLALQFAISAAVLNTQSQGQSVVTKLNTLSVLFDPSTRVFSVSYSVNTIYGAVKAVVSQTLG